MRKYFDFTFGEIWRVLSLSILLNLIGGIVAIKLNGFLFLDTIGTALGGILLGPWWGGTIGAVTNMILAARNLDVHYFEFLIVNVVVGIFWGYLGRGYWQLFFPNQSGWAIFKRILWLGLTGGVLSSFFAFPTRVDFRWILQPGEFENLLASKTQVNQNVIGIVYQWAAGIPPFEKGLLSPEGNSIRFLPFDLLVSVPDKILSVAFAAVIMYYVFPILRLQLQNADRVYNCYSCRASIVVFIMTYSIPLAVMLKTAFKTYNLPEGLSWLLPLLLSIFAFFFLAKSSRNQFLVRSEADKLQRNDRNMRVEMSSVDMWLVFNGILGGVGVFYLLLSARFASDMFEQLGKLRALGPAVLLPALSFLAWLIKFRTASKESS